MTSPDPHTPQLLTAFEAAVHVDGQDGVDVRPRVLDANTGLQTLLDSGSQVTVVKAGPDDIVDNSIKLESVGGDTVKCYGKTTITVKINRKPYHITAIKANVKETILGWDFLKKHRLNFEWTEWGDCYLKDRRNGIKAPLTHTTIPHNSVPRLRHPSASVQKDPEPLEEFDIQFSIDSLENIKISQDSPKHDPDYMKLINK